MLRDFLIVGTGSFVGGGLRYLLSAFLQTVFVNFYNRHISSHPAAPSVLGTFTVNIIGCFVIGFLCQAAATRYGLPKSLNLLLTTGFCGGFTTFSTFINESASIFNNGSTLVAISYILFSVIISLAALAGGIGLAHIIR